jgi:ubiquinone/menaquinone biosynthesis C-methylase UbiE
VSAYSSHDVDEERRRLRLQAEVLEPISDRIFDGIGATQGMRVLDVACGAMGLLRPLSRRVGASGSVVGSDVSDAMLDHTRAFVAEAGLGNVTLVKDDAYATALEPASFDLVHARFVLAPLGRDEVLAGQLERLVKPGGWIVLEEPSSASWRVWPDGGAHDALVEVIKRAYDRHMGGFEAGSRLFDLARRRGWRDVALDVQCFAMTPGHRYLAAPLSMAKSLRSVILRDTPEADLDARVEAARALYERPGTQGLSFALLQLRARAGEGTARSS